MLSGHLRTFSGDTLKQTFATPAELKAAIDDEVALRDAYADEFSAQVIQTRQPITAEQMSTEKDRLAQAINWMFGVKNAQMPTDRSLRRMDSVWAAYTGDHSFNGVFNPDLVQRQEFMASPAMLPNLVLDALNKVVIDRLKMPSAYSWFENLVTVAPNDGTLHTIKWMSYGGMNYLPIVGDTAAYPEVNYTDMKETADFAKRGAYVGITRAMIMNSDIQQMQAVPKMLSRAAMLTRSKAIASIFTMNSGTGPVMATDSKALFHTDHENLATTALGTDGTAWEAAMSAMYNTPMLGADADGEVVLGVYPKYLLIPQILTTTARKMIGAGDGVPTSYQTTAEAWADQRVAEIVVVPNFTDATDWAYLADKEDSPTLMMSYSANPGGGSHPAPELFIANDQTSGLLFSNDLLPIKVRDEFAFGVSDFRGIGKRNVAG